MGIFDMKLTQEILKDLIDYNPDSGIATWKERDSKYCKCPRTMKTFNSRYAGKRIGLERPKANGYIQVVASVMNHHVLLHRAIWLYMTGEWPKGQIDHIDNDGTNNRWENLRDVDGFKNQQNKSKHRNNTSGVTGVYLDKTCNRWVAECMINRVKHRLGRFAYEDLDLAAMEVMEFRAEHGFDPSHGMEFAPYHNVGAIK